ncbi:hypothetical protein [Sulfurimonas sp.]|uniref:hypothetical protein n=1 Tax=Sulfurimonas sp. TaxID=2022749 RepID=UPI003568BD34
MKKLILLSLLAAVSMAQDWEYMLYATGAKFKDKKMMYYSVLNDGKKGSIAYGEKLLIANGGVLKKYLAKWKHKEAYEMDVLRILGDNGWELITIKGEVNNSNQNYYFKRKK